MPYLKVPQCTKKLFYKKVFLEYQKKGRDENKSQNTISIYKLDTKCTMYK